MGKQPTIPVPADLHTLRNRAKKLLEDTAFPSYDPGLFLVDDEIRPFWIDKRHDLTGTGDQACPTISTGLFIVHEHEVPENECEVIFGTFNHVWRRDNPTTADETIVLLPVDAAAGFILFNMRKAKNQPYIIETDYNVPTISTAPNDTLRQSLQGITFLAQNGPQLFSVGMANQLQTFLLPSKSKFQVTFQMMPTEPFVAGPPPSGGVPNPWVIPDYSDSDQSDTNNRIDFAGSAAFGVRMPQRLYEILKNSREVGLLGPEAS